MCFHLSVACAVCGGGRWSLVVLGNLILLASLVEWCFHAGMQFLFYGIRKKRTIHNAAFLLPSFHLSTRLFPISVVDCQRSLWQTSGMPQCFFFVKQWLSLWFAAMDTILIQCIVYGWLMLSEMLTSPIEFFRTLALLYVFATESSHRQLALDDFRNLVFP